MSCWILKAGEHKVLYIYLCGKCYKCGGNIEDLRLANSDHSRWSPKHADKYESGFDLSSELIDRLHLQSGTSKEVCVPLDDKPEYYEKKTVWYHYKCPEKK